MTQNIITSKFTELMTIMTRMLEYPFTSDDNYCAEQEHKKRNSGLIIYSTNSEGECELLH